LIITSDISYLTGSRERNQGFVDGGMFSLSILYALQYNNVSACALNASFNSKDDKKIKNLIGIPDNENLIMFISTGSFLDVSKVPNSARHKVEDLVEYL
jgi:hypothetical protein